MATTATGDIEPESTRDRARGFRRDAHVARFATVIDEAVQRA